MVLVAPSVAARATTLATRVPLRSRLCVVLMALQKLHLAIPALMLGARKDEVVPTTLLGASSGGAAAATTTTSAVMTASPPKLEHYDREVQGCDCICHRL
ncbi:hypothetical protein NXY56_000587 [Leishmania guyanensis]